MIIIPLYEGHKLIIFGNSSYFKLNHSSDKIIRFLKHKNNSFLNDTFKDGITSYTKDSCKAYVNLPEKVCKNIIEIYVSPITFIFLE